MGRKAGLVWVVLMTVLAPLSVLALIPELQYVDKEALKGMLGDPKVLIIDVRIPKD